MNTSTHRIESLGRFVATIALIVSVTSALGDTLEADNGNIITGKVQSFDQRGIIMESPLSEQPLSVKASSFNNLVFSHSNKPSSSHSEILTLINGDQLPCKILSLEKNIINITTWYAGDMTIERSKIASIRFGLIAEELIFSGNEQPEKWTDVSGKWTMPMDLHYRGSGYLAQEVILPEKVRFHYELQWQDLPNFAFRFFAENESATKNQNTYELIFNSKGLEIRRYPNDTDRASRIASIDAPVIEQPHQKEKKSLNIDLRVDKNEGLISLYLDSKFVGTWHDPLGSVGGNYVIFNNRSKRPENCTIGNISITSLSGGVKPRFFDADAMSSKTDILTDSEGDYIHGNFISLETNDTDQRMIVMETSDTKDIRRIPEHRISNLSFKKSENKSSAAKSLYTLRLKNEGKLQINQSKISGPEVSALHPILGPLHLSRSSLKSMSSSSSKFADDEAPNAASVKVTLMNGDKLSGTLKSIKNSRLALSANYFNEAAILEASQILSIQMNQEAHAQKPETYTRIQLHNRNQETSGDTLTGQLQELNKDSIKINIPYGKTLTLKRSMIQSLDIISKGNGQYHGPNSIDEWERSAAAKSLGNANAWHFNNGSLVAPIDRAESIGKDIGLNKKSRISFDVSWQQYLNLSLQLYSSDPKSRQPSGCYQFNFDQYAVTMVTRTKGKDQGLVRQRFPANIRVKPKKSNFDIYIDRETGTAHIYLDGQHACIIQSPIPDPQDLGTALSFVSHRLRPSSISNINVSSWHGITSHNLEADNKDAKPKNEQPHNITLINGDNIPCNVGIIKDDQMNVKTEYTPINIPIEKIKSITWKGKREEPKKYRGDVRAWFHTGGFITLKLASIIDAKLKGYSQATGDAEIDTQSFSRIDFNIYSEDANELRTEYLAE